MLDYLSGIPRRLDFGFVPSPSGGGLHAIQEEEVHNCYLIIKGYMPDLSTPDRVKCMGLVTGVGFTQVVFGYPNEEAYFGDPRGELNHGFYEIEGSGWSKAIDEYNDRTFGSTFASEETARHFFIGSKDVSCQILADDLTVEAFPDKSFGEVAGTIQKRIRDRFGG